MHSMHSQEKLLQASRAMLIENYGRLPLAMVRGDGAMIYDADGKAYIDFFPGFGAGGVAGHCHPEIVSAVRQQASTLLSCGNLFTSGPQVDLAQRITRHGFGGKVFFCHSGAEADEAALKLMRLAAGPGRYKIISFHNCFHGRTMGGLSLAPESFQKGFEPMLEGNIKCTLGDLEGVAGAIDNETAGVIVEPVQAEGGMNIPSVEFMQGLRKLCSERGVLLGVDEVWTGPARTGKWFAYQHYGITPDIMTLAKAIGGGLPVGAMVAAESCAEVLAPGTHGCTMGGNPLCAAAGAATMKLIEDQNLVARGEKLGKQTMQALRDAGFGCVSDIRGKGLMIGLALDETVPAKEIMLKCLEQGLIVCSAKNNVLRLAPPLIIEEETLHKGMDILIQAVKSR